MRKKIIAVCVINLMLMLSGFSVNAINRQELPVKLMIEGNMLITEFDNNRTIEIDSAGNIIWEKNGMTAPHDAERLPNGNTLITSYGDQFVIEVDSSGNIVWEMTGLNLPMDAERLSNGNTLITEFGGDCVIEVDSSDNIIWEITGLNDPFDAERLPNGNTLVVECPYPYGARVIEIDSIGNVVWNKSGLSGPVDADRLPNGNTLITEHVGKSVIEVDKSGIVVWAMTGLGHPKDAERLPNGNTLIVETSGNRVIEVNNVGDIVWEKTGLYYPSDVESLLNYPPESPEIDGPSSGSTGVEYEFTFSAIDFNNDDVKYYVHWGDGSTDETTFQGSGELVTLSHTWTRKANYIVKAKAEDVFGESSDWTEFEVIIPRNKAYKFYLIEVMLKQYPIVFQFFNFMQGII
jgi:hypothetical protein